MILVSLIWFNGRSSGIDHVVNGQLRDEVEYYQKELKRQEQIIVAYSEGLKRDSARVRTLETELRNVINIADENACGVSSDVTDRLRGIFEADQTRNSTDTD